MFRATSSFIVLLSFTLFSFFSLKLVSIFFITMLFSIVGDSNVRRHMNVSNCRAVPMMSSAEMKSCGSLAIFAETLRSIRSDSSSVIVSCISNFLTSSDAGDGPSTLASLRVEPVLQDVRGILLDFCQEQPERTWFVSPPMYRTTPQWYLDGMSEIMLKFSQIFRLDKPKNLFLLPSFTSLDLEADGVHLSPYSGFEFVSSLFYAAEDILKSAKLPSNVMQTRQTESIRVLEDRVLVIEQDQKRLNKSVEAKHVVAAEAADFAENQRYCLILLLHP